MRFICNSVLILSLGLALSGCEDTTTPLTVATMAKGGFELGVQAAVAKDNFDLCMGLRGGQETAQGFIRYYPLGVEEAKNPDGTLELPGGTFDASTTCYTIKPDGWPGTQSPGMAEAIKATGHGAVGIFRQAVADNKDMDEDTKQQMNLIADAMEVLGDSIADEAVGDADLVFDYPAVTITYPVDVPITRDKTKILIGGVSPNLPKLDDDDSAEGDDDSAEVVTEPVS